MSEMSDLKIEVIVDYLWVRKAADKNAEQSRTVAKGDQFHVFEVVFAANNTETWYRIVYGFICAKDLNEEYTKVIKNDEIIDGGSGDEDDDKELSSEELENEKYKEVLEDATDFGDLDTIDFSKYMSDFGSGKNKSYNFLTNCRGVDGMPYQFMSQVDPRIAGSSYGREYTENVVSRMPLLFLSPGKPIFMKGYSKDEQMNVLKGYMVKKIGNEIDELLDKKNGRYYSFGFNYSEYYEYVNPMAQSAASFLGLGDVIYDGTPLRSYKWQNYSNSALKNFVSSNESLAFYIDSETQISESFSNNVSESELMQFTSSASNLSREVQFLMGGLSGLDLTKLSSNMDAVQNDFKEFGNKYLGEDGIANSLIGSLVDTGLTTVVAGGKMIFPEIWQDSSYSRDYDISIKLRSPDCDDLSIYLNLIVPMLKLVALTAPQSLGANGYKSPFLIRGYYKGFFNCNMGIITSMSISKGDKCRWTRRGLPTQIDINFTLKDLYTMITLTKSVNPIKFCQNTCLMDWISNMCAININKPDIVRTIELYSTMIFNNEKNLLTLDGFSGIKQGMTNLMSHYFGR